jgi:predicted DCC family thiol-disulfide oxidoreductase YuxK
MVFDGDCAFCSSSVRAMERFIKRRPRIVAWQFTDVAELGLTSAQCEEALQWVHEDGRIESAHMAVSRALMFGGKGWWLLGAVIRIPGISWLSGVVYRWIARNRHRMPGGTPACSLPQAQRDASR